MAKKIDFTIPGRPVPAVRMTQKSKLGQLCKVNFRQAIKGRMVCKCGGIMVSARFRGEEFNLCTSCTIHTWKIRRILLAG